jgi:hypothetical protein
MAKRIRVVFQAQDNGQKFPVYFTPGASLEEQIASASRKLKARELTRSDSDDGELALEQLEFFLKAGRS